jgi:hypothetical protein
VLDVVGLTANQSPPESVEAEASKATPVFGMSLFTETDWAAGGLPPVSNRNDSDDGLRDSIGPEATVRVTGIVSGFGVAPVIVTVPEYLPGVSPSGLVDTHTFVGVIPLVGVSASQFPPDTEAVKLAPGGVLLSMKHTWSGAGRPSLYRNEMD